MKLLKRIKATLLFAIYCFVHDVKAISKNIKVFLIFLAIFIVVGYGSSLITEFTGFQNPSVPIIGGLPLIGAGLAFVIYYYWAKKEL